MTDRSNHPKPLNINLIVSMVMRLLICRTACCTATLYRMYCRYSYENAAMKKELAATEVGNVATFLLSPLASAGRSAALGLLPRFSSAVTALHLLLVGLLVVLLLLLLCTCCFHGMCCRCRPAAAFA